MRPRPADDFWSDNPCGGGNTLAERRRLRFATEPWMVGKLSEIGRDHDRILEVGCGQGTDTIEICQSMKPGGFYIGLDYSVGSVAVARAAITEASTPVTPTFQVGDARALPFDSGSFDAVYSMGVLHHVDNISATIAEVARVLRPGGRAYIGLYNSASIKLIAAHALRAIQRGADAMLRCDRCLLPLARAIPQAGIGTMAIECFGVPILQSFTRRQIEALFAGFEDVRMHNRTSFRSLWFVEARRPTVP